MQVHEEEIVFLVNSADPSLVEAFTNSQNLCRQLEAHGAQRIPTPRGEDNSLRGTLAQHLNAIYLLESRRLRFLSVDKQKSVLRTRRAERERKAKALSDQEKEKRARKAAYARAWRARQTPEKKQEIYETIQRAKKKATPYELELRRKQERERWAKQSPDERAAIRERRRAREAAKRAQAGQAQ